MTSVPGRLGRGLPVVLLYAAPAALALIVGAAAVRQPVPALVVAVAVLAIGLSALRPMVIPLLALPTLLVVARLDLGGVDVSVSDAALAAAVLPAALLGVRPYSPSMRNLMWLTLVYQASTLFTVIANAYTANLVEWVHAWFLTGGALVVGWGVGRAGWARTAMALVATVASLIGLAVVAQFVINVGQGSFEAVYVQWPYPMHKNFTGTTLGIVAAVAFAAPPWLTPRRAVATALFWWCTLAVLLSQSGQAIIALAVAVGVVVVRSGQARRRSKLILLAAVPAVWAVISLARSELASGNVHNSTSQRLTWFAESWDLWLSSPITGIGLRWWYTDRAPERFQPPNAELEVLTSAGLLGLAGFIVLMIGTLVILWRVEPLYGTVAFVAVLSRFVQGQFDLFWVAVQISLAFAVVGICLGAKASADAESAPRGSVVGEDAPAA